MAGGLHYESLSDLPPRMRQQVAGKIVTDLLQANPVTGDTAKQSKYHNQKNVANGISFDSKKEANRYYALLDAVKAGVITDLRLQHDFTLQEAYTTHEGERIRAIRYRADFSYRVVFHNYEIITCVGLADLEYWRGIVRKYGSGALVVEDVKSKATRTKDYRMKYKMMADKGYHIREV